MNREEIQNALDKSSDGDSSIILSETELELSESEKSDKDSVDEDAEEVPESEANSGEDDDDPAWAPELRQRTKRINITSSDDESDGEDFKNQTGMDLEEDSDSSISYDSDSDFEPKAPASKRKKSQGNRGTAKKSRTEINHKDLCVACTDGGDLLLCDYCTDVYHLECLDPPLTEVPEGKWKCPKCALVEMPPIDKILLWRWTGAGKKKKREFFVHFRGKSYWDCEWVTEFYLKVKQPPTLRAYWKKWDDQVPATVGELDWMGGVNFDENDPLTEKFYRYGVKPEWLDPQRVIAEKKSNGRSLYYVKWRDLPYESCTWEDEKTTANKVPGFSLAVAKYHAFKNAKGRSRNSRTSAVVEAFIPPSTPTTDPRKHYETQPDYLGVEGKNLKLHPYQLEGLNWLRHSWSHKVNTILGDEMGLGKTIQAISFLYSLWKEGHSKGPFLVTAPLSTVLNWEREFEAWAPDFYVVTFTGFQESRKILRQYEFVHEENRATNTNQLRVKGPVKFHVLLTSYENINVESTCLGSINWKVIVVDEAHRLRKDSSLFFRTLREYQVSYKLLLTGTPLQNRLDELFFLLNFLVPSKFHNLEEFLCEFEDVSKENQVKKLHSMLRCHMLRRFKADVFKDIPAKAEVIVRVEMTPFQKKYYKYLLTKNFEMLRTNNKSSTRLQSLFVHLVKCCNHPYLFPAAVEEHDRTYEDDEEGQQRALVEASGKLVLLQRMLRMLKDEGRRVLIFSQMTKVLDILEDFMELEGYGYERLDGSITGDTRQASIDRFNAPGAKQFVFLLSTRAGGLGINLATSDTVIIYDSDWNPHNDVQALSRAHRIGQKNKVMIYRFVTHNTVEEKVIETAKRKMMLNTLIVRPGMQEGKFFTKEEMEEIIRFGTMALFKDKSNKKVEIHYTDEELKQLLDRSIIRDTQQDSSEQGGFNDYLNSFKLANYAEREGSDSESQPVPKTEPITHTAAVEPKPGSSGGKSEGTLSSDHWDQLMKQQIQEEMSTPKNRSQREVRYRNKPVYKVDEDDEASQSPKKSLKVKISPPKEPTETEDPEWNDVEEVIFSSSEEESDEEVDKTIETKGVQQKQAMSNKMDILKYLPKPKSQETQDHIDEAIERAIKGSETPVKSLHQSGIIESVFSETDEDASEQDGEVDEEEKENENKFPVRITSTHRSQRGISQDFGNANEESSDSLETIPIKDNSSTFSL